nr:hypothetical protein [Staphylococcus haemolyticus]
MLFRSDFKRALGSYRECMKFSKNADMLAATAHWLYMTLRRLRRDGEARKVLELVRDDAEIIENHDYQTLLLMYKGRADRQCVGQGKSVDLGGRRIIKKKKNVRPAVRQSMSETTPLDTRAATMPLVHCSLRLTITG